LTDSLGQMNGPIVALALQPDEEPNANHGPLSDGDLVVAAVFAIVVVGVLGFDLVRTWWQTNQWRRDARRRRRELR
jgi:hypothetical protein